MSLKSLEFLKMILSQPTAPFKEMHVGSIIENELKQNRVPFFRDPVGNLVLGVSSKKEYLRLVSQKTDEPLRIFIAHMDHPGFHGIEWINPSQLKIKWHGGAPTQHLENAPVWLADDQGLLGEGHLTQVQLASSGRTIDSAHIEVSPSDRRDAPAQEIFGGFRFRAPYWIEGNLIYTKAADDLVGTFAICSVATELFLKGRNKKGAPFIGLLTRAEEVGFIGAIAHFELGWHKKAKRPLLAVSLETSRTLPGAEVGKGPVVRLGDRYTVFDAGYLRVFSDLAQKILPDRHQRRVMDGGTCEATAAQVYGLKTVGISVPLGNYHNQSFEGGPDSAGPMGPAPEFVHLQDIAGLIELCHGLMTPKLPWARPWKSKHEEFSKELKKYKSHLKLK